MSERIAAPFLVRVCDEDTTSTVVGCALPR